MSSFSEMLLYTIFLIYALIFSYKMRYRTNGLSENANRLKYDQGGEISKDIKTI